MRHVKWNWDFFFVFALTLWFLEEMGPNNPKITFPKWNNFWAHHSLCFSNSDWACGGFAWITYTLMCSIVVSKIVRICVFNLGFPLVWTLLFCSKEMAPHFGCLYVSSQLMANCCCLVSSQWLARSWISFVFVVRFIHYFSRDEFDSL